MNKPCQNCAKKDKYNYRTKTYNIFGSIYVLCDECSELKLKEIKNRKIYV
jgi:hypothetical protein